MMVGYGLEQAAVKPLMTDGSVPNTALKLGGGLGREGRQAITLLTPARWKRGSLIVSGI
ncbi:MAG TPA: hypothetical protein VFA74_07170 [Terriglobales bacterium]|nr:hypothetical protein [Terriglobales bacterium]